MSNILEYTLSLKDKVSGALKTIGINNDLMLNSFVKLETQSKQVSDMFSKMGKSAHTLQQKINLLKSERDLLPESSLKTIRQYNSEINKLERRVTKLQTLNGSPIKKMFGDAINSLPGFATNPVVLAGAGIGVAIRKGMEADFQKANMVTLFKGNEKAAQDMFNKIADYGKKSPYEKAGLIEAQSTMMQFGIEGNKSFEILKQIGDIALGDSGKMKSLSLAFAQASSAGKLQGQDLLQMINAGFNPLQVITERTGESMESLKGRMEKGKISAAELAQAFTWATDESGLFYKGAEKAGETLGGKWSTLIDSLNEMLLSVYNSLSPILMPLIEMATVVLDILGQGINRVFSKLSEGSPIVTGFAIAIGSVAAAVLLYNSYLAITKALQAGFTIEVWKTNFAFLANPIVWIIALIVGLVAGIVYAWNKFEGFRKFMYSLWETIKQVFSNIADMFKAVFAPIGEAVQAFQERRWGDVAKAVLAMNPVSVAIRAGKFVADGGLTKGFDEAWQRGDAMGAASWKVSQQKKGADKVSLPFEFPITTPQGKQTDKTGLKNKITNPAGNTGGGTSNGLQKTNEAIATGGTKNTTIHITIGKQIETVTVQTVQGIKEGAEQIGGVLLDELTRVIQMSQTLA